MRAISAFVAISAGCAACAASTPAPIRPDGPHEPRPDPTAIVDLALGHQQACAVRADGRVVCLGSWAGMVDDADTRSTDPAIIAGVDGVVQVSGNEWSWCARRADGTVVCWGRPDWKPHAIAVTGAVEISASCARVGRGGGDVVCWDEHGAAPTPIHDAIALGKRDGGATCVIRRDKTAACWGDNRWGEVGDGTTEPREAPVTVRGVSGVDEIASSTFLGTCARSGAVVTCWGGETNERRLVPTVVTGLGRAAQIAVAEYHACARLEDGTVACWGSNHSEQLGVPGVGGRYGDRPPPGGIYDRDAPGLVPGVSGVVDVEVGGGEPCGGCGSVCARKRDGAIACWGGNMGGYEPTPLDLRVR